MKNSKWKYTQTVAIRNYDDLERELERANLHQKFLGAMLNNDKDLMKRAFSLPNLIQRGIVSLIGENDDDQEEGPNLMQNKFLSIITKWLLRRFF